MINDLLTKEDLILFTSGTRFTLGSIYLQEGFKDVVANFDLFVRDMPQKRNYLVFAGLEHVVDFLLNLKFTPAQLQWLKRTYDFPPAVMDYYKKFRFTGNLYAMPEGNLFFPNEPVIRVVAPIIEAQMLEIYLTNTVFLQTILASKLSRFVNAAKGMHTVLGFNRSYGIDVAMKMDRIGQIIGIGEPCVAITSFRNPKIATWSYSTFHHFISAFDSELDAFRAHFKHSLDRGSILVDTYNITRGIKNFIIVAKEMKKATGKKTPKAIFIDSGDLCELSFKARKMLDEAGFQKTKIIAVSNLDEYKVLKMVRSRAPIDTCGGTTNILTPIDAPVLEVVYKLTEIEKNGQRIPKMKLSSKKISLPGRKQVFRIEKHGQYIGDVIGLENEKIRGKKLLVPYIKNGKLVRKLPSLEEIHKYYEREKKKFKRELFAIDKKVKYPVEISAELNKMTAQTKKQIQKQFIN